MESALHSTNGKFELQGSFGARRSELPALLGQEPLTRFLKSEPTVNFTVFDAAIWIGSRVCGFIPVRAFRADGANVPKPGSVTLSPSATAVCTDEMNAFRALSASVLLRFAPLAIDSTSSPLFTGRTSAIAVCRGHENPIGHEGQAFTHMQREYRPLFARTVQCFRNVR